MARSYGRGTLCYDRGRWERDRQELVSEHVVYDKEPYARGDMLWLWKMGDSRWRWEGAMSYGKGRCERDGQ